MKVLLALISIFFLAFTPLQNEQNKYTAKGIRLYNEGNYKKAVKSLKRAVNIDRKDGNAYFYLARAYVALDGVYNRLSAALAFEKATQIEPENTEYLYEFALLRWKQEFNWNAEIMFNEVIALDSSFSAAAVSLAQLYEESALWYKGMVVRGTPIVMDKFYKKRQKQAKEVLSDALHHSGNDEDIYIQLGLTYLTEENWPEMEKLFTKAIALNPDNKESYLYRAYALLQMDNGTEAEKNFMKARSLMDEKERVVMDSYEALLSPEQLKQYKKRKNGRLAEGASDRYWISKNPSFLTGINERRLEHWARFAYVNLRFGKPRKGIIGWKTERGEVYLRYGMPVRITRTRPEAELRLIPSVETWFYPDFEIRFEDRVLNRNYTLQNRSKQMYDEMIARMPERHITRLDAITVEFDCQTAVFKGDSGKTVLEFYYTVPFKKGRNFRDGNDFWQTVKYGIYLFTPEWIPIIDKTGKYTLKYIVADSTDYPYITAAEIAVRPGIYTYSLEYLNTFNTFFGKRRDTVVLPDFQTSKLQMSDIVIGKESKMETEKDTGRFSARWFVPQPSLIFRPDEKLYLFYEIYNLYYNNIGETSFKITTEIGRLPDTENAFEKIAGLLKNVSGKKEYMPVISNSFMQKSRKADEKELYGLDISTLKPGVYILSCIVEDLNSKNKTVSSKRIQIEY